MVPTGDELCPVLKSNLIGGLSRRPLGEHLSAHKTPIGTLPRCAVNRVSRSHFSNPFVGAVRHQDSCLRRNAENALVLTTSIRVDRPLERHSLDAIENGLYLDLDPLDLRQDACACGLKETWLQRGGNRVRLRKEFGGQPHGFILYARMFVSMPNAGVLDKAPWNTTMWLAGTEVCQVLATPINAAKPLLRAALVGPQRPVSQPPAAPAGLSIRITSLTSPVSPGAGARLEIQTAPGAVCNIVVVYKSGPSRARGLEPKAADTGGQIAWVWHVGTNTTSGTWPILIECVFGNQRIETQTEFTVQ